MDSSHGWTLPARYSIPLISAGRPTTLAIAVKPLHLGAGVIIAGKTLSPNFPTKPGSYSPSAKGLTDGFVLRLDDLHGVLVWSTYLGGSGDDYVGALEGR